MHALTRPMSETYCWQSRIASGSHAARCCGVHCCAAAGQDATVSARPSSTAAAAFIGPSFCWALRISIFALHLVSDLVSTIHSTTMGQRRQLSLVTGALDEGSALATQRCATGSLRFQGSNVCHLSAFGGKRTCHDCRWSIDRALLTQSGHERGAFAAMQGP